MVAESLRHNTPDWHVKHACPACTYKLTDEPELTFSLLYAMDGNDSLKRVLRRSLDTDESLGTSSELPTGQQLAIRAGTPLLQDAHLENLCEARWKNMDDTKTKKAWGIYDETGIFVAVCRHGFSLLVADMVQSGELAKYPLAIVSKLLDVFGSNLGGGYDIGCQFKTTLGQQFPRTPRTDSKISRLANRTFSKSNSLASALRYASVFHRQQGHRHLLEHNDDFEVYANLYLKVTDVAVFEGWLAEEKVYLQSLDCEKPEVETLQMEYWQKLVNLTASEILATLRLPERHALEDHERYLKLVQALECKLEWQRVGRLVANRKYQRALDRLEGLIVARIFELTRMNRAGTGVTMCSVAIRTALTTYNTIAGSMHPPRRTLKWDEVVEYAFLADFDLLRDTCRDGPLLQNVSCCEEIERLDIERYLRECENQLQATSPALAHQIAIHRNTRGRFNSRHLKRLYDISKLPGFRGTLTPGVSANTSPGESASIANAQIPTRMIVQPPPVHHTASSLAVDTQDDLDARRKRTR
ncbi:hypothetical protein DEU56DRAFT_874508 [Suillus clintonianus]|uniref:uncharacterized protein n=1 Tax=Suillus clintonianus TaxID=1904413 RepID=UPI001B87F971|nr:uncharacterized protein DEU56DRAFT_874508 [Suillus clintonianus]KAG2109486.1 hypothetical protein DEU56DRAFT_874508 [Suillus clintonianus]